ncbi:MAG: hypothetical protein NC048_10040 [Bacteroides sp.]|nr:hypothetical protein [Bacteroides sp.]MCM1555814.1 hypothetical protein [Bacteroides sp.]
MKTMKGNEKTSAFEKALDNYLALLKKSPLAKCWRRFAYNMKFVCAVARAEFRKVWTGKEYAVFMSDNFDRFYVFSEQELGGILRWAKKRKFMRRPEMRRRIVYRTAV